MGRKIDIAASTTTTTVKAKKVSLTGVQIKDLLRASGVEVPDAAEVSFKVPGGGDWSNMDADVNEFNTVDIRWEERETTQS